MNRAQKTTLLILFTVSMMTVLSGCNTIKDKIEEVKKPHPATEIVYLENRDNGVVYKDFSIENIDGVFKNKKFSLVYDSEDGIYRIYKKDDVGVVTIMGNSEKVIESEPPDLPNKNSGFIGQNLFMVEFENPSTGKYHGTIFSENMEIRITLNNKETVMGVVSQILNTAR